MKRGRKPARKVRIEPGEVPPPPDWLTGHGLELWNRVADRLARTGRLAVEDLDHLAGCCRWYGMYREVIERALEMDLGTAARRNAVIEARDCWKAFVESARKFGMSPHDRDQLKIDTSEVQPVQTRKR